jgi:hypothetical protein
MSGAGEVVLDAIFAFINCRLSNAACFFLLVIIAGLMSYGLYLMSEPALFAGDLTVLGLDEVLLWYCTSVTDT